MTEKMVKVCFKMQDGSKFIGQLALVDDESLYEFITDDTMDPLIPVYNTTVSGTSVETLLVNKNHVSLWWEVK